MSLTSVLSGREVINLLWTFLRANGRRLGDRLSLAALAQRVENDFVGSPCGVLDQVMIACARAGMGTHYAPRDGTVRHVPLGAPAADLRFVSLDTGTVRPGLAQSTYAVRRAECERLTALLAPAFGIRCLAELSTGQTVLRTRTGRDLTAQYPEIHTIHELVNQVNAVIDGEIVAFDEDGQNSFGVLQQRMNLSNPREIDRIRARIPVALVVFDLLWLDGHDVTGLALEQRRELASNSTRCWHPAT